MGFCPSGSGSCRYIPRMFLSEARKTKWFVQSHVCKAQPASLYREQLTRNLVALANYPLPTSRQCTVIYHQTISLECAGIKMHGQSFFFNFGATVSLFTAEQTHSNTNKRSQYWKNTENHLGILPVKFLLVLNYLDILSSAHICSNLSISWLQSNDSTLPASLVVYAP